MTFLPIVARELRIASRRRSTYWVRTAVGTAVILGGAWLFTMLHTRSPQEIAQALFGLLSGSAALYCLLSGLRSTADCLSREKREGTLGLLFLTDLKGYDVVLGKLAANSLNVLYGLLAVVPVLGVPMLLGGISPAQFGRMALVAINAMFISLAIGMCASAGNRVARKSTSLAVFLVVLLTLGFPAWSGWLRHLNGVTTTSSYLPIPSPAFTYFMAWDTPYGLTPLRFWLSLGVVHVTAWLFLIAASIIVPHTWQDRPAGVKKLKWRERWLLWAYGNSLERKSFRQRLLERNAFFWLAARARLKPALVWGTVGLLGCGWVWGLIKFKEEWLNAGTFVATGVVLNVLIKAWFASESIRQLAEERRQGSLELLLSTPLTIHDIFRGQLFALARQFLGPLILTVLVAIVLMFAPFSDHMDSDERIPWVCYWLGGLTVFIADLVALYWVGMWHGLTAKNPNRAVTATLGRVWALPWLIYALLVLVFSLGSIVGMQEPDWKTVLSVFVIVSLGLDIWFSVYSRRRLLADFRKCASARFENTGSWWNKKAQGA